jgi:DNA-binding NtrC family response regulator/tetratricopeptide (TPR) repeat protein
MTVSDPVGTGQLTGHRRWCRLSDSRKLLADMADADLEQLVGESPAMASVRSDLRRLLTLARDRGRLPAILIQGETGTGKGLVARLLHRHGPRAGGPLVDLNCAAIPETLLEGELFGYERGAFTDARRSKPGLFQTASGGVLFLDEVGLLPDSVQAKLLTAIEERAVRRLGGTTKEKFDTWIVSATNMDLALAVRERRFREDLYHRLAVLTLHLPPLRERAGDVVILAERFLERACSEYSVPTKSLAPDARALVARSPWPGNVRELANVMERLALLADRTEVNAGELEVAMRGDRVAASPAAPGAAGEREQILAALEATGGNIMRTAARLGVSRNTIRARMDRWGLRSGRETAPGTPAPVESAPPGAPESVAAPPPVPAPTLGTVRWERRHVTLLRMTLVGTADLSVDAGRLLSLATDKVLGFGGRTEALGAVSFDASFGVVPIENATRRAVSAALAIHKAFVDASRTDVAAITVLHTAQATIGHAADAIMIDQADWPAFSGVLRRLRERAGPGAVHVSAATAPFVERHFELRADESGDVGAAPSFTVVRRDPAEIGGWWKLTRFVDRKAEMDLLRARWDLARDGRGQVVGVVGEPGAGKSRLLLEFTRTLDPAAVLLLRATMSASEDPSGGRPAASLLGLLFGLDPGDAPAEIRDRLALRLGALSLEDALLPPLAALLGVEVDDPDWARLGPPQRGRRMLDALRRVIVQESLRRPLVIVLEDLHWIDADTQAAIDSLIDVVPSARILVVLAYRPEYRHGWTGKTFYTQLRVDPLLPDASDQLLDHLLGEVPDLAPLKRQLTAWTEGNPFFLEESVRTLAETGVLVGAPGSFQATAEVVAHALPATVEDTLAARIHRLPADARHVLQCAAAIGTDFADAVVVAVADVPEDAVGHSLRALEDAEFVYLAAGSPEPARTFKHALTHLVAYRSLPHERQRVLHARILAALEGRPAGPPDTHTKALAEHAVRGEVWNKAVDYLRQAGARALARSENRVAADYFERALAALERTSDPTALADVAVDLRLDLRHALTPLGEVDRILRHLREAETVAARTGDRRRLGRVVSFQTNCLFQLGDHPRAIECGHRALAIARDLDDLPMAIAAEQFMGRALHAQGNYRAAVEIFRRLAASLGGERATQNLGLPVPPGVFARSHLVWCLAELGEFEEALRTGDEAVGLAEATGQPEALQWACYPLGLLALDRGELETAVALLDRVLSICRTAELPVYMPRTSAALGHAHVLLGRADAVSMLEQAVADAEKRRQVNVHTSALVRLADAYLRLGRIDEATSAAERAVDLSRKRSERGIEARALRLQAMAYQAGAPLRLEEAEALYRLALTIAGELEMRPQTAQGRLGLGTLLSATGRTHDAREVLYAAQTDARHLGLTRVAEEAALELATLD